MRRSEVVVVLGASPKPERYAFRAFEMLRQYGHHPIPVNPAYREILGEQCYPCIGDVTQKADTITLYLSRKRSDPLIEEIVAIKPRRIIMNPGAENPDLARKAKADGVEIVEGCTLVMLRSGRF